MLIQRLSQLCMIALLLLSTTNTTKAQNIDSSHKTDDIRLALDSIAKLPDPSQQFQAQLTLTSSQSWRMNPFTVQYIEDYLSKVPADAPLIPAAVNFLFGEFLNVNLQEFERSLYYYKQAIALVPPQEELLKLKIWSRITSISLDLSNLEDAIPAADSCISKARQQNQWFTLAHCLKCKGDIRRDYFQEKPSKVAAYKEAQENYLRSFHNNLDQKDTIAALLNLYFLTSISLEMEALAPAGAYINTALVLISPDKRHDDFRAQNYFLRGKLLSSQGLLEPALAAFKTAFDQFSINKDTARLFQTGILVGDIHFQEKKYRLAIGHLLASLALSPKVSSMEYLRDIQYLLYRSYKMIGDNKNALIAQEAYMLAKDSINQTDQLHLLAAMEAERGLQEKQKEIQEKQAKIEKQALINWFLLTSGVVLLIVLGLLLFDFIRIRNARNKLAERNEIIYQQKQQLEELDGLKSRFFTNISHELRTPLTLIMAPLQQVLERYQPDQEEALLLQTAAKNTQGLHRLINELLDFSKIESGKAELNLTPNNIPNLLSQLTDNFVHLATSKNVHLSFQNQSKDSLSVYIDRDYIQKILNNLLSNALKFSPEESSITILLSESEDHLLISVSDEGPGIHPDDLPHVFDRFYQSKQHDLHVNNSSGLGLAFSAELAKLMNGRVWVESEFGKGSTFFLQILKKVAPMVPSNGQEMNDLKPKEVESLDSERSSPQILPKPLRTEDQATVLIVEDNHEVRDYLSNLLNQHYQVVSARDGKEALQVISKPNTPLQSGKNLIISDLIMPRMDGYQLLNQLKSNPQFAYVPIIMLTASHHQKDRLKALTIGVDDYLTKPFDNQELLIRVHNLLNRSWERGQQNNSEEEDTPSLNTASNGMPSPLEIKHLAWLKDLETFALKNIGSTQFGVSFLSAYAKMSERNFQRQIKKITGLTPSEYIKEIRLHHARELLELGQVKSVKAVSRAVGFNNQEYFSTIFQQRFGRKPSSYL